MKHFLIVVLCLAHSYFLKSQVISYFHILPSTATDVDSISIDFELTFPWYGSSKLSSTLLPYADSITYTGCYFNPGFVQTDSYIKDTVLLGKMPIGTYHFRFIRNIVWFPTDTFCSNIGYSVTFDTTINVTAASSVISPSTFSIGPSLHPNPTTTHITITGAAPNTTSTITNLHGQVLLQSEIRNPQSDISVEPLPPGLYFCILQSGQERKVLRFVKQ